MKRKEKKWNEIKWKEKKWNEKKRAGKEREDNWIGLDWIGLGMRGIPKILESGNFRQKLLISKYIFSMFTVRSLSVS